MSSFRRLALAFCSAPLALALAACGDQAGEGQPAGEPIAPIAAPAGTTWAETAVETPEGGFRIGNPEAPIKLLEFASNTCSHCAEFSQTASAPLEEYVNSGRVSYEIRNLIRDPIDLTIAVLTRCGGAASFHPLATEAWANFEPILQAVQTNSAALEQTSQVPQDQRFQAIGEASGLVDFFAARGISRDQSMQCLGDTARVQAIAEKSEAQAEEHNVQGTPTFFLNGTLIEGTTWEMIEPALQAAGAR